MRVQAGYDPTRKLAAAQLTTPEQRAAPAAPMAYGGNRGHQRFRHHGLPRLTEEAA
jgi:hypothetical protein